jgi:hypothetical protein
MIPYDGGAAESATPFVEEHDSPVRHRDGRLCLERLQDDHPTGLGAQRLDGRGAGEARFGSKF